MNPTKDKTEKETKYIFVIGGVVSSLGKGIISSSLGALLKARNIKIFNKKCDPYLNIDPGTMNPYQHGEVFVTEDGAETDLDLGHYERFTSVNLNKTSNITAGRIYNNVLKKEREGVYLGNTVQVVPHITNEIKENIYKTARLVNTDVLIIEFGGTVGDIEIYPFAEAARQIYFEKGHQNVSFIFVTLVPTILVTNEVKSKPTQYAVRELGRLGIKPDILALRCSEELNKGIVDKISMFCNVPSDSIIQAIDTDNIYKIPLQLHSQNFDQSIVDRLKLNGTTPKLKEWYELIDKVDKLEHDINIAIIGKYVELEDAYKSVIESLRIAGYHQNIKVKVKMINSRVINENNIEKKLKNIAGILIPGGFGLEGIEGKIIAIKYAREQKIPFLGICLGMQLALVEYARNILGLKNANSIEFDKKTPYPIIYLIKGTKESDQKGGTLRLGNYDCELKNNSLAYKCYNQQSIKERHRHRFEVNEKYIPQFEKAGIVFSGKNPQTNLAEIIEIPNHPFFIACQYHPEFTSKLIKPNQLFFHFVEASNKLMLNK